MFEMLALLSLETPSLSEVLAREVGRSVAHATLVMDRPSGFSDMPDGRRAYHWHKAAWAEAPGAACSYTVYATNPGGEPYALAAWEIVEIEPSAPGC